MTTRIAVALVALLVALVAHAARVEAETATRVDCSERVDPQRIRNDSFDVRRAGRRVVELRWSGGQSVSDGADQGRGHTCEAWLDPRHFGFVVHGATTTATLRDGPFCSVEFVDRGGLTIVLPHCSTKYLCDDPERLRPMILDLARQSCRPLQPASRERKPA